MMKVYVEYSKVMYDYIIERLDEDNMSELDFEFI